MSARESLRVYLVTHHDGKLTGSLLATSALLLMTPFSINNFVQGRWLLGLGSLAIVMFFLAWVADMFVTPALLSYLPERSRQTAGERRSGGQATPSDLNAPEPALSK